MTEEQMRRALVLISEAATLKRQLDTFVLTKRDAATRGETIQVGDPALGSSGGYNRIDVAIPEEARRHVYRLWRKDVAIKFNAAVRELNQLGAHHGFDLLKVEAVHG